MVASPIFDENRNVVGILYGSRDMEAAQSAGTGHPIRPLEAQLVQVLANSVSAGLIRMSILERLKQAEQLAAVGQARDISFTTCVDRSAMRNNLPRCCGKMTPPR